jgi:hypothetical protein
MGIGPSFVKTQVFANSNGDFEVFVSLRILAFCVLGSIGVLAGCGGHGGSSIPHVATSSTPTPKATPTASATPSSIATLSPAQVTTISTKSDTIFSTLPHTTLAADMQALGTQLVASGSVQSANVVPGGLDTILSDGMEMVFDGEGLVYPGATAPVTASATTSSSSFRRHPAEVVNPDLQSAAHGIDLLVNEDSIMNSFFDPQRQTDMATTLGSVGLNTSPYASAEADMTLANIVGLGSLQQLDYVSISSHGIPIRPLAGTGYDQDYMWTTDTPLSAGLLTQYASDIAAKTILYDHSMSPTGSIVPVCGLAPVCTGPKVGITAGFLLAHLRFNPGAIVDNYSCYGQFANMKSVGSKLQPGGVGRYLGWTMSVDGVPADETQAFLIDRLAGEPSALLGQYITQQNPAQRQFSFDDIFAQMAVENRSGYLQSLGGGSASWAYNFNIASGGYYTKSDYGGESVSDPVIMYGLPSIATLQIAENLGSGTMVINGEFPTVPGIVAITDSAGSHKLPITSWTPTAITVTLSATGTGSAGQVQVVSSLGILSNTVPLTQWSGNLTYAEKDTTIPDVGGVSGSGTGTLGVAFNVDFRADVHPTVVSIDTAPVAQNFVFSSVESDSTASFSNFDGTFTSSGDSPQTATFSLAGSGNSMPMVLPTGTVLPVNGFAIGLYGVQPGPCNNSSFGPQGGPGNIFCPSMGFVEADAGTCYDPASTPLCSGSLSPLQFFGLPPGVGNVGGQLILTMDPAAYGVTVSSDSASFLSNHFDGYSFNREATASMSGTIGAARYAPTYSLPTTSAKRRRLKT